MARRRFSDLPLEVSPLCIKREVQLRVDYL